MQPVSCTNDTRLCGLTNKKDVPTIVRNLLKCIAKHSFSYECICYQNILMVFYTFYLNFLTLKKDLIINNEHKSMVFIYHTSRVFTILKWLKHSWMCMHIWYVILWFLVPTMSVPFQQHLNMAKLVATPMLAMTSKLT